MSFGLFYNKNWYYLPKLQNGEAFTLRKSKSYKRGIVDNNQQNLTPIDFTQGKLRDM